MNMPQPASKHPEIAGIDLAQLKLIFSTERGDMIDTIRALRLTRMSISEFDRVMRAAAEVGYVRYLHDTRRPDWSGWQVGAKAHRLTLDRIGPRVTRQQADHVIAEIVSRARAINSEPDRLHRIRRISLFGSALHDGAEFGDVDVSVEIVRRDLDDAERKRIEGIWKERAPESRKRGIMSIFAGDTTDRLDMLRALKKGLKGLSMMNHVPEELGTAYRVLYETNDAGCELPASSEIIPATGPGKTESFPQLYSEQFVDDAPAISTPADLPALNDPIELKEAQWVTTGCLWSLEAEWPLHEDHQLAALAPLYGAQHLCPAWKTDEPGLQMLVEALAWAEQHGAEIAKAPRVVELRIGNGSRYADFDRGNWQLRVSREADLVDAFLNRIQQLTATTRADIAAEFAICMALGRMIEELGPPGGAKTTIELDLARVTRNRYEALPRLGRLAAEVRRVAISSLGSSIGRKTRNGKFRYSDAEVRWDSEDGKIELGTVGLDQITDKEHRVFHDAVVSDARINAEKWVRLLEEIPGLTTMTMRANRQFRDG